MNIPWYLDPALWIDISWGFFFAGIISVVFAILAGIHGHDVDHHFEYDTSHELSVDHEVSVDHHVEISHVDHDVAHGIDFHGDFGVDHSGFHEVSQGAPFSMLVGTFFLVYGGSGLTLFSISKNVYLNIVGMIGIAIFSIFSLNTFFKKFFKTGTYVWRPEYAIGRTAVVVLDVDENRGTIRIDTGTPMGTIKYPARSRDPKKKFRRGEIVYVVEWREGFALIDKNYNNMEVNK